MYAARTCSASSASLSRHPVAKCLPASRMIHIGRRVILPSALRRAGRSHNRTPLLRRGIAPSFPRYCGASCNPYPRRARSQAVPSPLPYAIHWPSWSRRGTPAQPQRRVAEACRAQPYLVLERGCASENIHCRYQSVLPARHSRLKVPEIVIRPPSPSCWRNVEGARAMPGIPFTLHHAARTRCWLQSWAATSKTGIWICEVGFVARNGFLVGV